MKTLNLILTIVVILIAQQGYAQSEEASIRETLNKYIEGSTNGKPSLLKEAFYPDLNLYYIRNNQFAVWSGVDYIADTKEGQPTGETGRILSIDYQGTAAIAKAEIAPSNGSTPYIDYFILLKAKGKWTIIHKMFTRSSNSNPETEKAEIERPLLDYIEGTANGQPERLRRAFHEDFNLYFVRDDKISTWSGESYIGNIKPGQKSNRIGKIISIDFDNNAAVAKVEIDTPDNKRIFTDYFLLLKMQGTWKIVHKSFSIRNY